MRRGLGKQLVNKGKEVWRIMKEVESSDSVKKNTLSKLELEERGVVFDEQVIAEEINSFFAKIGEGKIGSAGEAAFLYAGEDCGNSYLSHAVTKEDIAKIIDGLKNKMTFGPDGLPVAIMKRV